MADNGSPLQSASDAERSTTSFKLVKQASDRYRRAGSRILRARKALRDAEVEYAEAQRTLRLAIDAVQTPLPGSDPTRVSSFADPEHALDAPDYRSGAGADVREP